VFVGKHNFLSCEHPAHKITLRVTLPLLGRIPAIHSTRRQKKNRRLAAVTAAIKLSPWPSTRTQPPRRRWAHQMSAPMVREIPGPCLRHPYATIIWCAYYSYCLCDMLPLRGTWYVPTYLFKYVRMQWYVRMPMPNAKQQNAVYSLCTSNPRQHKRGGRGILAKHSCSAIRAVAPRRARGQANALTSRTLRRVGVLHDRHHLHSE